MEKTELKTTPLGRTGPEITRVGFGAWAIGGGGYDWGWGAQDDEDSIAAIHHALDLGVNWIDAAAQYGFGHSEGAVGRGLAGLDERPYVFNGRPAGRAGADHAPEPAPRLAAARARRQPRAAGARRGRPLPGSGSVPQEPGR